MELQNIQILWYLPSGIYKITQCLKYCILQRGPYIKNVFLRAERSGKASDF